MKKLKFIKQINKNNLVVGIILIFIILISPWLWVLVKNSSPSLYKTVRIINFKNEVSKDQINILRGEMIKSKVPNVLGRVIVNKFSYYSMEVTKRYLETFIAVRTYPIRHHMHFYIILESTLIPLL